MLAMIFAQRCFFNNLLNLINFSKINQVRPDQYCSHPVLLREMHY